MDLACEILNMKLLQLVNSRLKRILTRASCTTLKIEILLDGNFRNVTRIKHLLRESFIEVPGALNQENKLKKCFSNAQFTWYIYFFKFLYLGKRYTAIQHREKFTTNFNTVILNIIRLYLLIIKIIIKIYINTFIILISHCKEFSTDF